MTSSVVLDASVVAKWFLPASNEPFSEQALGLLDAFSKGLITISVPDLFWAEMAYLLQKAARRGRIEENLIHDGLQKLNELDLLTTPTGQLIHAAALIATASDISAYDAVYVALAVASGGVLITADERLANKTAARFPVQIVSAIRGIT